MEENNQIIDDTQYTEMETLVIDDTVYETKLTTKFRHRKAYERPDRNKLVAFIPGTIREIYVQEGQQVKEGDKLLILEAMKMKNTIFAAFDAKVKKIYISTEKNVAKNDLMIEFE